MSDKPKCCAEVYRNYDWYPCGHHGKYQHDNKWYCGLHNPEAKAKRNARERARWARETKIRGAKSEVDRLRNEVIEAARSMADVYPPAVLLPANILDALAEVDARVFALGRAESKLAALEAQQ